MRLLPRALRLAAYLCAAMQLLNGSEYVGSAACAECHQARYEEQTASRHAHSLRRVEASLIGGVLLKQGHSPDNWLVYEQGANAIVVHEKGIPETVTLEWAFGAGAQGSTAVGRLGGQYIEHRFSYYSRIQGLAPTFGHPAHVSAPIAEFGVLQDSRTIFRCFNCHGTNARLGPSGPEFTGFLPGVQCERCHGPGSSHIKAAKAGASIEDVRKEIVNPGRFRAEMLIEICGQCHRLPIPDMGEEPELENPVTVRFAPIGLLASRCFRASRTLSCITCHNPHDNALPRTDISYSQKCLVCHGSDRTTVKLCRRREKENCLPCHMQQASLGPNLRFTDHRIRVYQ